MSILFRLAILACIASVVVAQSSSTGAAGGSVTSTGGSTPTGTGGAVPSGTGGSVPSGTGGSVPSGTGGAAGTRPASTSVCDYYANALGLSGINLVSAIVKRAVVGSVATGGPAVGATNYNAGVLANPVTAPFFTNPAYRNPNGPAATANGGFGGGTSMPNYATNTTADGVLLDHLNRFFYVGLGCSAASLAGGAAPAAPATGDMTSIHATQPITAAVFSAFNGEIATTAAGYGVTAPDVQAVGGVLGSFSRGGSSTNIICNDPSCPCATGATCSTSAASTLSGSFAVVLLAAAVAVFAARR